jgi:hypothetical protein
MMMASNLVDGTLLKHVFFPYAELRTTAVRASGARFAYYTTAEVATRILQTQQIWMRNAAVMNDFMEISHGFECLRAAYSGESGDVLKRALDSCFPGLPEELEAVFDSWLPIIHRDTYLTCVSEHRADEDLRGRLSMWRAYGATTGVAIVLNGAVMFAESDTLGAYSSPVFYGEARDFAAAFMSFAKGIEVRAALVASLGRETVKNAMFQVFRFATLCTKHPGFSEELEWRVIASPLLNPSGRLTSNVEIVRGVPQMVVKLKLENAPDEGLIGLAIPELVNRIIIGPSEFPQVTERALYQLMSDLGVPDAQKKIVVSDIPLRHNA